MEDMHCLFSFNYGQRFQFLLYLKYLQMLLYGYVMSGPCRKLVRCLTISLFQFCLGALCCHPLVLTVWFDHRSPDVNFNIWSQDISYMSWGLCVSEGNCRGYADSLGSEALLWCPEVFDYPTTVNITELAGSFGLGLCSIVWMADQKDRMFSQIHTKTTLHPYVFCEQK